MAWTYEQKFNGLTDGDINGQDSFTVENADQFLVNTTEAFEGTKSLKKATTASGSCFRAGLSVTTGVMYWAMRCSAIGTADRYFEMAWRDAGGLEMARVRMKNNAGALDLTFSNGDDETVLNAGASLDTWYIFAWEWSKDQGGAGVHQSRVKWKVSGGTWSAFTAWKNDVQATDGTVEKIRMGGYEDTIGYYDTITPTDPTVVTDKDIPVESGVGEENVFINKDLIISEAGIGAEDIKINKELFLTDSGVGAEAITITIFAAKDVSDSGAGVDDVTVTKLPALVEKHILIKVYDNKGNYLESWDDATFEGFTKEINGGLGECQIKLGRKFDDYGEYFDVKHNNEVRILITDRDTRGTADKHVLIYSGYISKYTPWIEGGKEGVVVHCLGYYTQLAQDIYKNGTTTTIQETAADVGVMFRNLMNRYIAETTTPKLHYSLESIMATSTTATYAFEMITYREAIEVVKSLAPTDWWWYVDQWHKVNFKSKPTTTDHTFIFGRHFYSVKVEKSMEKIKNALLFWNRETADNKIYKLYTDTASVSTHGRRIIKHIDQGRVGATIDADKIGDAFVAEHKEPDIKVLVEIIDNAEDPYRGYDIESIEPGQTCIFSGFSEALSETFKENMMITKVEYTLEKVRLTIEPTRAGIVDRLEHVARQISEANTKNAPSSYST